MQLLNVYFILNFKEHFGLIFINVQDILTCVQKLILYCEMFQYVKRLVDLNVDPINFIELLYFLIQFEMF